MTGKYNPGHGTCTITWDINCERLLSPDKTQHLIPCDRCGSCHWQPLNVVGLLCDSCAITENPCDMCNPYNAPGFVLNAGQVVACWQCNPNNIRGYVSVPVLVGERISNAG